jgi:hypothetical protein
VNPADPADHPPRRGPLVTAAVAGALALLVAVLGVLGGLDTRSSTPPRVGPGATVDQGLFKVQVLDARAGRIKVNSFEPAKNVLITRLRVTNLGDRSRGVSTFLAGLVAEPAPGRQVAADSMDSEGKVGDANTTEIHPRLPVEVQALWSLPTGTAPRSVTLALRTWVYGQSFTSDTFDWTVGKASPLTARAVLPVRTGATS